MQAKTKAALEDAWARYVAPVEASIGAETLDILTRLADAIILEPQPKSPGADDWPVGEAGPAFGERRRFVL